MKVLCLIKVSLLFLFLAAFNVGCRCKAISNHQWIGPRAPKIAEAKDVERNLRDEVNKPVPGFARSMGFMTAQFKRIGIMGWSDLGYEGELSALVVQTAKSTDQFYTVDMKLESLRLDDVDVPLTTERFLRAEVCLCDVELDDDELPQVGEKVWMRGRMVWDGDGFIEIHPRNRTEVRRERKKVE